MIQIDMAEVTKDITRVTRKLGRLGALCEDLVPQAVAPAVVKLMQIYDPPKYVTRKAAYGRTFQTRKQQRWFFWALSTGLINVPYHRTKRMKEAWEVVGKGKNTMVVNNTEAAKYTMGDDTQSRHERLVGWSTVSYRLRNPGKTIAKAATDAVKDAIKKAGLS